MADPKPRMFFLCDGQLVSEEKIWKFPNAHIVGELRVRFSRDIERNAVYLAYYPASLPTDKLPLIYPFIGVLVPYSPKVCCTLCERTAKFEIHPSTFDALMAHLGVVVSALEEKG